MSDSLWHEHPTGLIPRGTVCEQCGRYNARDITACVLIFSENKILLVKRDHEPGNGGWALPGGYVSWDETLMEAAKRELQEETGLTAEKMQLIGTRSDNSSGDGRQNIDIYFYTNQVTGTEKKQIGEVRDIQWFSPDNLPENLVFDYKRLLEFFLPEIIKNPQAPTPVVL